MRHIYRFFAAVLSVVIAGSMAPALYLQETLPDHFTVAAGEELQLAPQYQFISCNSSEEDTALIVSNTGSREYSMELKLFGLIKIKDASVRVVEPQEVAICGVPFGIKMTTEGVMVVGTGTVQTEHGAVSPARTAGIREGDLLLSVNGYTALSNSIIAQLVRQSEGTPLTLCYQREKKTFTTTVTPALSITDKQYHIGLWVRDSSAGIGTLTFCDPISGEFAGLGHAICDVDTGQLMPLAQGEVVRASITGLAVGLPGKPGELQGTFLDEQNWGRVCENRSSGIYGQFFDDWHNFPIITTAHSQEVETGPAQLLCTISGTEPQYYDVEIERIHSYEDSSGRNFIVRITDTDLLERTGGILQGMSGSPLVQNEKLIGAITHVFIQDPSRGYGIFVENMLEKAG